ncbi:hypothetical protein O6H91_05G081400 [Diphasiastrum complanatum]|uniref:Uncharacterized protein n=1 Tax=Diphasiastrum complanatum TaxID=34168 RepID=A0ACC2DQ78_DIPCM|nr:hypothetical protein O6H91_05G081400 [Diphasiastrum complanatum]
MMGSGKLSGLGLGLGLAEQQKGKMVKGEGFSPEGLGVLVVDDDPVCLLILDRMLRQCKYNVTTCSRATEALAILREKRENYDLVISDVYMPDMDGFKLLELIGLEMDLPVIMMSAVGETDVVMKGITHGACDYLLKPVRMEELRNIWQHVIRRRSGSRDLIKDEASGEWDDNEKALESHCDTDSSSKKRKEKLEFVDEQFDNMNSMKKARVIWSFELHQQFVNAVNVLGIDKAVPKRILEIMNVQGLTRENVASHLQKYRLYLKRLSGVNPQPLPVASFQASEGGHFKGSMHVQPGGRSSSTSTGTKSTTNLGIFGRSLGQLDDGTLTTLAQLQAFEQRQIAASRSQRLEGYEPMHVSQSHPIQPASANMEMVDFQQLPGLEFDLDLLMNPTPTIQPPTTISPATNLEDDFSLRAADATLGSSNPTRISADFGASFSFLPANSRFNMSDVPDSNFSVGSEEFLSNLSPRVCGSMLNTVFPNQEGKQTDPFL